MLGARRADARSAPQARLWYHLVMDPVVGAVVVAALVVGVAVVALVVSRGRSNVRVRAPFGSSVDVERDPVSGVRLDRVRAGRDVKAAGSTIEARRTDAARDATFDASGGGGGEGPKG